ncbi:hypothetical protein B0I35DRAFT_473119 [Stachybotrys elegans]|uniref:Uncharacterized protein n=1 Tax=Stachybotrys elegans TaxID=80388 RepID=A0A8K0SYF1_9HYPO|nr:hypothetical protein B0I35DRAFT_473119 [Stachybotrys elegans]
MDTAVSVYPVYLGIWINWSYGKVFGSTLTVTRSNGALLIAFLAFFVTLVGSQLWKIICFLLFKLFSHPTPKDALHNQRQAILRNSSTPIGGAWSLLQMLHAWTTAKTSTSWVQPLRRLLPLLVGTVVIAVALAAASGFSSQLVVGNEVLIDGAKCGLLKTNSFDDQTLTTLYFPNLRRQLKRAAEYAQRCYESPTATDGCDTLIQPSLSMNITADAACPFDDSLCISQDANIMVESGPIDSHKHLGINWPPEERFQLYHRMHCAPLVTDGHRSTYESNNGTYTRYQYGDSSLPGSDCNCTIAVNMDMLDINMKSTTSLFLEPHQDMLISAVSARLTKESDKPVASNFNPIPDLTGHNGDVTVVFLLPDVIYFTEQPSEDIWYRATEPIQVPAPATNNQSEPFVNMTYYMPSEPAWPMGCTQQSQVCKRDICTGWASETDVQAATEDLGIAFRALDTPYFRNLLTTPSNIFTALGIEALASRYRNSASGSVFQDRQLEEYVTRPDKYDQAHICNSQKILSTAYTSFSVFGLVATLLGGVIIVLVSAAIESIDAFLQKRFTSRKWEYSRSEWRAAHALHL